MCIILYTISLILGLTLHNDKENEYGAILERYCNYAKEKLFGKNTGLNSSIMFIIIGGYIGLLFLNYKIISIILIIKIYSIIGIKEKN